MNTQTPVCALCGRPAHFRFASGGPDSTPTLRCWRHAVFYGPVVRRALQVSAVVGTLLFLINQLDVVLSSKVTPLVVLKIGLTYLVPFLVSTYSALEINRLRPAPSAQREAPPEMPRAPA